MQERRNSSALAMELRFSCTNPSTWYQSITHTRKGYSQSQLTIQYNLLWPSDAKWHHRSSSSYKLCNGLLCNWYQAFASVAECETAVSPLLLNWRYCSLVLNYQHNLQNQHWLITMKPSVKHQTGLTEISISINTEDFIYNHPSISFPWMDGWMDG